MAKESVFPGINNMQLHIMLSSKFNDKFRFTVDEVAELLNWL